MNGLFVFICIVLLGFVQCNPSPVQSSKNIFSRVTSYNVTVCPEDDAKTWSYDFHSCFFDRKYKDTGRDLNNIVNRILEHADDCVKKSSKPCRPDLGGFKIVMDNVILQMKDYSKLYLQEITHNRQKIKDLECVEKSISETSYYNCFKSALVIKNPSRNTFRNEIEKAISCTNEANGKCSKAAKTRLNRMVRDILKVPQPQKENIPDDPEPPRPWYDWIIRPFVSLWNTIKSWFGW